MFSKEVIGKMQKGAYLINTARGGICDRDAVVEALESGQLAGDLPCYILQQQLCLVIATCRL